MQILTKTNALKTLSLIATTSLFSLFLTSASFAADLDISGGDLTFDASSGIANNITVEISSNNYIISDSGEDIDLGAGALAENCSGDGTGSITCPNSSIDSITINTDDEADTINIEEIDDGIEVNGGDDNDVINIGDSSDSLDEIDDTVTINGDLGSDTINFNDQDDSDDNDYRITASKVTRSGGIIINIAEIESLDLNAGEGDDEIDVDSIDFTLEVNAGDGKDEITVGGLDSTLDDISDDLEIDGQSGTDILILDDADDTGDNDFTITSTTIGRSGISDIIYKNMETVSIDAGEGKNEINIEETDNDLDELIIDSGDGDDTFNLGNSDDTIDEINGDITLDAGNDEDRLNINDDKDNDENTYIVTETQIERSGKDIFHKNFEEIDIDAGEDDDTFDVVPLKDTEINIDGGDDSSGDELNVDTDGDDATDDGSSVELDNREPVNYSDIEDVSLGDFDISTSSDEVPFTDIEGNTFEDYILNCFENDVCKGYENDEYRPDNDIKRKEFFSLMIRAFDIDVDTDGVDECEDSEDADVHEDNMLTLLNLEIISGDSNGLCRPNDPITRGEVAKVVYNTLDHIGEDVSDEYDYPFEDNSGNKFTDEIAWLAETEVGGESIVSGEENDDGDKVFNYDDNITRGQVTKIIDNSMEL